MKKIMIRRTPKKENNIEIVGRAATDRTITIKKLCLELKCFHIDLEAF